MIPQLGFDQEKLIDSGVHSPHSVCLTLPLQPNRAHGIDHSSGLGLGHTRKLPGASDCGGQGIGAAFSPVAVVGHAGVNS